MKRTLTAQQIAAVIGIDLETARRWAKAGAPYSRRSGRLYFDESEIREWMLANNRGAKPGRPPEQLSLEAIDWKAAGEEWLARQRRAKALTAEGKLVETAIIEKWIDENVSIARNKFLNLGSRLSPILEGKDSAERQEIIDATVCEILNELANTPVPLPAQLEAPGKTEAERVGGKKSKARKVGKR